MARTRWILIGLLSVRLISTVGADDSIGIVIYAEGPRMSIYRDGTLEAFQLGYDNVIGLPVYSGDLIQTEDDTFVEIQLAPAQNVIKVAENTTFRLTTIEGSGSGSFEVTYGRVRAKVESLARNSRFELRGRSAIAGVRGTDFGYDVIADRSGSVASTVYCFEGSVEVALPAIGAEAGPAVVIEAQEMVSLVSRDDGEPPTEPTAVAINRAVTSYWRTHDFRADPALPSEIPYRFPELQDRVREERGVELDFLSVEERPSQPEELESRTVAPAEAPEEVEELSEEEIARRVAARRQFNRTAGWIVTTTGVFLTGGSFALEYYGDQLAPGMGNRASVQDAMRIYGSILLATGVASFLLSFL